LPIVVVRKPPSDHIELTWRATVIAAASAHQCFSRARAGAPYRTARTAAPADMPTNNASSFAMRRGLGRTAVVTRMISLDTLRFWFAEFLNRQGNGRLGEA